MGRNDAMRPICPSPGGLARAGANVRAFHMETDPSNAHAHLRWRSAQLIEIKSRHIAPL